MFRRKGKTPNVSNCRQFCGLHGTIDKYNLRMVLLPAVLVSLFPGTAPASSTSELALLEGRLF